MPRIHFNELFLQHPDGSIEPRYRIRVGGVEFGPGVRFSNGAVFAGIDFTLFRDHDLEVQEEADIRVINGIYQ